MQSTWNEVSHTFHFEKISQLIQKIAQSIWISQWKFWFSKTSQEHFFLKPWFHYDVTKLRSTSHILRIFSPVYLCAKLSGKVISFKSVWTYHSSPIIGILFERFGKELQDWLLFTTQRSERISSPHLFFAVCFPLQSLFSEPYKGIGKIGRDLYTALNFRQIKPALWKEYTTNRALHGVKKCIDKKR